MNEMGRYIKHCNRFIVSQLWKFCPFCGQFIHTSGIITVEQRHKLGSEITLDLPVLDAPVPKVGSVKMSDLRKEITAFGSNFKARSRLELEQHLATLIFPTVNPLTGF